MPVRLKIEITEEDLLSDLQGDDEGESFDLAPVEEILRERCREVQGFTTRNRVVLGNFAFQKTAMVQDLRQSAEVLARHDLIAALAGHPEARQEVSNRGVSTDPREIDEAPPEQEFLILDADSSQQTVIRNAMALRNGVIQGPPGTGKSQTIANLIAELAAAGKRVLFVAEKRAALQVVLDRLANRGLGHLALDLHGAEISRADVMARLSESLEIVSQAPASSPRRLHSDFVKRRTVLLKHLQRMHALRAPTEMSVYAMQGRLLALGGKDRVRTRWSGPALAALTPARIEDARDALREAHQDWDLFLRQSDSPWNGAAIEDAEAAHTSYENARVLAQELGELLERMRTRSAALDLECPTNADELDAQVALLAEADERLGEFDVEVILDYGVEGGESHEEAFEHACGEFIRVINYAATQPNIPFMSIKVTGISRLGLLEKLDRSVEMNAGTLMNRFEAGLEACSEAERQEWHRLEDRLDRICRVASEKGVGVLIDAEETWIQDPVDVITMKMMDRFNKSGCVIYNTLQLYRHDRLAFLRDSIEAAEKRGFILGVKLVRGAYMEKERERAHEKGYPSPIQPDKESTDRDYDDGIRLCLDHLDKVALIVASHNDKSNLLTAGIMDGKGIDHHHPHVHFSQLFGMSDNITFNLARSGFRVSKYLPFGPIADVVPYLMRRAQENSSVAGQTGRELSLIGREVARRKKQ